MRPGYSSQPSRRNFDQVNVNGAREYKLTGLSNYSPWFFLTSSKFLDSVQSFGVLCATSLLARQPLPLRFRLDDTLLLRFLKQKKEFI